MYIVSNGRHKIKPQKSSGMVFGGVNGGKDTTRGCSLK